MAIRLSMAWRRMAAISSGEGSITVRATVSRSMAMGGADGGYHLRLFCNHIADAVFAAQPRHNGRAAASAAHQAQKLRVQLIILQHGLHSFIHALYGFIQNRLCKGLRLLAVLLPQHREALLHIFQIAKA